MDGSSFLVVLYALAGIPIKLAIVLGFGLQRQVWRRVTTEDLERIVAAVVVGTAVLFSIGLVWYTQALGFPRTIPLIEGVLGLLGLAGIRVITRLRAEGRWRHHGTSEGHAPPGAPGGRGECGHAHRSRDTPASRDVDGTGGVLGR